MAIRLHKSREKNSTPALQIKDAIDTGLKIEEVYKDAKFYQNARRKEAISKIIRDCNGTLGMTGKIKNGCLYREKGLSEIWQKDIDGDVICDHAVPVTELVRQYRENDKDIRRLIFSPVCRIRKVSDERLTKKGYAKKGFKAGLPLFRYSFLEKPDLELVTHQGQNVDPKIWTEQDHWDLIESTNELRPVLRELEFTLVPTRSMERERKQKL